MTTIVYQNDKLISDKAFTFTVDRPENLFAAKEELEECRKSEPEFDTLMKHSLDTGIFEHRENGDLYYNNRQGKIITKTNGLTIHGKPVLAYGVAGCINYFYGVNYFLEKGLNDMGLIDELAKDIRNNMKVNPIYSCDYLFVTEDGAYRLAVSYLNEKDEFIDENHFYFHPKTAETCTGIGSGYSRFKTFSHRDWASYDEYVTTKYPLEIVAFNASVDDPYTSEEFVVFDVETKTISPFDYE